MLFVLAWLACLHGWRSSVGGVGGVFAWVAWVAGRHEWRACVGSVLACVAWVGWVV